MSALVIEGHMDWGRKKRKESLEDPDEEKSEKFRND